MWETITQADIQRAKQAWQQMRDRILERHQAEIKALEMDANLIRNLETGLHLFHQRFKAAPQLPGNGSDSAPSIAPQKENGTNGTAIEQSPEKQTVIELPRSPATGEFGPNFGRAS